MSRRSALRISRGFFVATALLLTFAVGCWEQWSDTWWPQMKRQKAVQAYESVSFQGRVEPFTPPEGTVPAADTVPRPSTPWTTPRRTPSRTPGR